MRIEDLIHRAQDGDGEAYAEAVTALNQSLYRVARAYLRSEEDIADAIQESILHGWRDLGKLNTPAYFKTWMIRILINECIRMQRRRKQETLVDFPASYDGKEITPWMSEGKSERDEWQPGCGLEFEEMMGVLSGQTADAMVLYYGEGYTTKEISELLEITEAAVRKRLSRGREEIRETYFRKGEAI